MLRALKPFQSLRQESLPWVGQVPAHWEIRPAFGVYGTKSVKNVGMRESTVLSLSYGQIKIRPPENLHGLVPESFETYQIVDPKDIIVRTTDLQNDRTSLRVGISPYRGIITSAYMCLQARPGVDPYYAHLLLHAYDLLKVLYAYGSGLRQNLDFSHIKRLPLALPPPDEQRAIVCFVDHADRKIRKYIRAKQKLIKLLEEHKRAIIHQAVTGGLDPNVKRKPSGIEWLGDVPEHWEVRAFTRCATERADYRGATPTKTESGIFLVTAKNIRKGWIDYETSKEYVSEFDYPKIMRRGLPKRGDLLFTTEAPLGHAALVDREDVALAQRVIRFRLEPRILHPNFALCSVLSPYFQQQLLRRGTGSTALGIKASKLPQLRILCPPLPEQEQILARIARDTGPLEAAADKANSEIELLRELRTRLIADVVTGKLDVREPAAKLQDEPAEGVETDELDTDEVDGEDMDESEVEEIAE